MVFQRPKWPVLTKEIKTVLPFEQIGKAKVLKPFLEVVWWIVMHSIFNLDSCTLGWSWLVLGDPWRIPNGKQWDRQNRLGGAKNITMLRAFHQTFSPSQMWHGTKPCKYDNGGVEEPGIPRKSHVHFRMNKGAKHHFDDTVNWNLWVKM